MGYWISDGVSQNGPYPAEELPRRGLRADSLVWREGMAEWQRADRVEELAPLLGASPQDAASGDADETADPVLVEQAADAHASAEPAWSPQPAPAPAWQPPAPPPAGDHAPPLGYQTPYGQSSYPFGAPKPQGMAIASMVLGIVSLVFLGAYCFGALPAIFAVIFGHVAMGRIRAGTEGGQGMAQAGLICGYISLGLTALAVIVVGLFILGVAAA